jgi:hypothetical protein
MKRELRIRLDIGFPVSSSPRSAGQIVLAVKLVEVNLDSPRLTGLPAGGGDIGNAATVEGSLEFFSHIVSNRKRRARVPPASL